MGALIPFNVICKVSFWHDVVIIGELYLVLNTFFGQFIWMIIKILQFKQTLQMLQSTDIFGVSYQLVKWLITNSQGNDILKVDMHLKYDIFSWFAVVIEFDLLTILHLSSLNGCKNNVFDTEMAV